ncbi:DNA mismatch repair ATPase msh1 [Ceratobasidium sp. 423]|nr:DNA mismatch repair ATPase msh1 [Ceratobasidium sp. 423]
MRCVLRARGKPPSGYNVCDATHLALPRGTRTLALSRHLNQTSAVTSRSLPKQLSIAEEIWNEILEEEGKEKFVSNSIEISIGRKKPEPVEGLTTTGSKEAPSARRTKRLRKVTETPMKEPEVQGALKTPKSLLPRTKLARDIIENHVKFPHCILLTRVGQFYESYFDQAPEVAKLLNIKLAQRRWGIRGRIVDMAGFPLAHLDRHLKTLVQTEKRFVALCEEFRKPGAPPGPKRRFGPSPFERRVVRVVTPGTLIDESFVNPYDNNYVCAIVPGGAGLNDIGIAWMDVATGEFFTQLSNLAQLRDDLARINPREIVLEKFLKGPKHVDHPINRALVDSPVSIAYCDAPKELGATLLEMRASPVIVDNITNVLVSDAAAELDLEDEATASVFSPAETLAIQLISAFLQANLRENMPTLTTPVRFQEDARMQIDAHTLAFRRKAYDNELGVKITVKVVITSVQEIQTRQALVALFYARPHLRRDMIALLRQTGDAIRLVQKMQLRRGDADDLLAIAETIGVHAHITSRLVLETRDTERVQENEDQFHSLELLLGRVSDLSQLAEKIGTAVHVTPLLMGETEAPPKVTPAVGFSDAPEDYVESKNWSIKHDFNPELRKLHKKLKKLKDEQEEMQYELQTEYSVPTLTLKIGVPHGIFVHVAKIRTYGSKLRTNEAFIPLSKSGSTESYFYKPWSQLGTAITECQAAILQAERDALESLRVVSCAVALRRNARIIDEIDVTVGFAELAAEMNFVRPVVNESLNFLTVNGRHPAVEIGLLTSGRVFTPNTVDLGPESRLMVITGPNMAGKSTVLRQSALIAILAQTGSFVPADYAEIGVVDRVFSRIGARDDLFHDRSTFMVEMLEAGEILRRATERSLVIMDEVGRGTTVRDGLAIAFATAHHIHSTNRCRAMFATHFHEVADMLGYYETEIEPVQRSPVRPSTKLFEPHCTRPHISFFCSDIASTGDSSTDEFTYSHRLQPGVNRESHGLRVARLGGMPDSAVEVARRVMERLRDGGPSRVTSSATQSVLQVGLGLGLGNREAMRKIGEDF